MTFFKKLLLFLVVPLYIVDQWTKWWVVGKFAPPWYPEHVGLHQITVIKGSFNLVRVHNQGVAFGMGNGSDWAPIVFLFVPLFAMGLIRFFWKKGVFEARLAQFSIALLISGVIGNLTDRLTQGFALAELKDAPFWERLKAGYVVDFLDFTIPVINYRWPSFNVADSCICVAAALLFISGLRDEKAKKAAEA